MPDSTWKKKRFNLNWYPAYSYSELPKGYHIDSVPQHWRALLQRVTPAEKGIPYAKNFYINNVKITNAQKAFEINGLQKSQIENFNLTNSLITDNVLSEMVLAKNWKYKNFEISISQKIDPKKIGGIENEERLK